MNSFDIRALNEQIERQSAFVTNLQTGMAQVIVGQKHLVESLLIGLGDYVAECEPVINDVVAMGLKGDDVGITVRLKIKSNGDTFTFHISYTSLESLKLFLERLANLLAPTLDHLRQFCREVYETILYENYTQ